MDDRTTGNVRQENRQQESQRDNSIRTQRKQESSTGENQGLRRMQDPGSESYGMERASQRNRYPSIFSVSPGEFFTMSPITLMRRFTEDIDRAFGLESNRNVT